MSKRKLIEKAPCSSCGEPCFPNSKRSKGRCGKCGKKAANAALTRFMSCKTGSYTPGTVKSIR